MTGIDPGANADPRAVVIEHIEAFNAHSSERLLAGFAADAIWVTGQDTTRGRAGLAELFDPWLWSLNPSLTVSRLAAEGNVVAAELREQLTVDGELRTMNIAVFFDVCDAQIVVAKVYREGHADID
ncbi:MAG: nuclear transport factor 2 family protein [Pseudonocardiales bacterium]|nr:nuclear transport factor 2 family protein [Pseudonocardiales bacterium]